MTPQTSAPARRPQARDDAWFRPRRQPGRIGPISLVRLLVFEVVQLTLCFVIFQQFWALVVGGLVGIAVAVAMFGWRGDLWWTDWLRLYLRFRRRRGFVAARHDDQRLSALCELAPDLSVADVEGPDGAPLGMGSDGSGWFVVTEVISDEPGPRPPVPFTSLARIAAEIEQDGVMMQVVLHSAPLPGTRARDHVTWIAVRLDAQAVAKSLIDSTHGDLDVPILLAELSRRVDRLLRRRGLRAKPLDADSLLNALVRSCDLAEPADRRPVRPTEAWDSWRSTSLTHGCFWMRAWPSAERGMLLWSALAEVPDAAVSIAFVLDSGHRGTGLQALVRVASKAPDYAQTCDTVMRLAEHAGGRLSKLDGQQLPAVYATAPTGGGAR